MPIRDPRTERHPRTDAPQARPTVEGRPTLDLLPSATVRRTDQPVPLHPAIAYGRPRRTETATHRPREAGCTVVAELDGDGLRVAALLGGRLGKVTSWRLDALAVASGSEPDLVPGILQALRGAVPAGTAVDLIGIAVPARVDAAGRILGGAPAGIPGDGCLRAALEAAFRAPVLVDSTAGLAALGEARQGAGRGHRDVAMLHLDAALSLGIVSDRRILRGAHGAAGAVGRILLPAHRGVTGDDGDARVPRIGAARSAAPTGFVRLDEIVGTTGLGRIFTDGTRPLELRPEVSDRRGKAAARQAIEGWALLISDLAAILDPEVIVLGGSVMATAPGLVPALERRVAELMPAIEGVPAPLLRLGRLGPRAALIGASLAGRAALQAGTIRRPERTAESAERGGRIRRAS